MNVFQFQMLNLSNENYHFFLSYFQDFIILDFSKKSRRHDWRYDKNTGFTNEELHSARGGKSFWPYNPGQNLLEHPENYALLTHPVYAEYAIEN